MHKVSSRKHLDNSIATRTNDESSVLTPRDVANAFASHCAVGYDVLRAGTFLERPEADAGVMAGGYGFAAVFGKGESGDGGGVG